MRLELVSLLIMAALTVTSCSSENKSSATIDSGSAATEEATAEESATRESVFVYNQQKNTPNRMVLSFTRGPVLLPSGYARLAGVVSGGKPIACLEIGGRGLALAKGEKADDYRVVRINGDSVVLEK